MGFAISIVAVNDSAQAIRGLWDRASEFELTPSMPSLNYPPHITLAIYDDLLREAAVPVAERAFAGQVPIHLDFHRIAFFDGNPMVLWAAPNPSEALQSIHAAIHRTLDQKLCHEHYRPDAWVPHCSIAVAVEETRRAEAVEFSRQHIEPFEVRFDAGEVVSFPPLVSVKRWPLQPPPATHQLC